MRTLAGGHFNSNNAAPKMEGPRASRGGVAGIAFFFKHRFPLSPHRDARCVDPDHKCHRGGGGCPAGGVRCLQTMLLVFLMANTMR